jgi:hypothetical protein
MIPMLSGGGYRRPGTLFDSSFTESGNSYPYQIPFVVSQTESYAISIYYDRVTPQGRIRVSRPTNTKRPGTLASITYGTGATPPYKTTAETGRDYDDVDYLQYAQSVDILTLVHPNYKPLQIRRGLIDDFTTDDFLTGSGTYTRDAVPYRDQNTTSITLTPSAVSGTITLTASSALFDAKHVGAQFKINHAGTIGCAKVTAFTDSTHVTATVLVNFGAITSQTLWWESAWSDYRGWPQTVGYHNGRRCYGGNATDRDTIWFSQADNFDVMSVAALILSGSPGDGATTGPTGDQPFSLTLSSQQLNEIQWLSPGKTLFAGTLGDEFLIEKEVDGSGFGCNNVKVTPQSHYGSSRHMPVRIGDELIFALASNDEIRALTFNQFENSYVADPVQLLFDEYPKPEPVTRRRRFRQYAWDESRRTLWCVDTAGNLFGMTRDRRLGVTTWHTHELGGYVSTETGGVAPAGSNSYNLCSGSVMSVAVVPNPILGVNDIWLTVKRKINGAFQWHIERFIGKGVASDTVNSAALAASGNYFVDSCVYDENGILQSVTEDHVSDGLYVDYAHLEAKSVSGTADAVGFNGVFSMNPMTVAAGKASLIAPYPTNYDTIGYHTAIGLPFSSIIEPVRLEAGSQIGSAQGAIKRIHKATVRFFKTLAAKLGASTDLLETIDFSNPSAPVGESPEFFTGDKVLDFEGDYDRDTYMYLLQDQPLPFSVISIVAEGMTYD